MQKRNDFVYDKIKELELQTPFFEVSFSEQYGQCAEDLIVSAMVRAFATREGKDASTLRYLEIGAHHPIATSATYLLHKDYKMRGVLVEANPHLIADLKRIRPHDIVIEAAVTDNPNKTVSFSIAKTPELSSLDAGFIDTWPGEGGGTAEIVSIQAIRMNDLMQRYFHDAPPFYMSVDVEGMDLKLLQDMDFSRYRPCIVQTEPSEHYIPDNGRQIIDYMSGNNYVLLAQTNVNLIFSNKETLIS